MEVLNKLLRMTVECSEDLGTVLEKLVDPKWGRHCTDPDDWRSYVPKGLQDLWPNLSSEARLVVYIVGEEQANRRGES